MNPTSNIGKTIYLFKEIKPCKKCQNPSSHGGKEEVNLHKKRRCHGLQGRNEMQYTPNRRLITPSIHHNHRIPDMH